MTTVAGLKKEIEKQKGGPMEKSGFYLFFEEEIEKEFAKRCEKVREDCIQTGIQTGMQTCIYDTIYRTLRLKYNAKPVSKRLQEKIDAINYYPALEDVQDAVITTPSLDAFERKVDEIAKQYAAEIKETRR